MTGRWPANVILSPGMAEALDQQSGTTGAHGGNRGTGPVSTKISATGLKDRMPSTSPNDTGGASRFFLQAGYEPWELEWILANGLRPCGGGL